MVQVAYAELYAHPLPQGHRFPMEKYTLIAEQLLYEGTLEPNQLIEPSAVQANVVLRTHCATYWKRLSELTLTPAEVRRTGFPLSQALVYREAVIAQGTLDVALHARKHGCGLNIAGGTHHAFSNRGEAFCLLNDQAIAANELLFLGLVQRILILDLDVHQGNGTAEIFRNDTRVFTFSMHGEKNYPGTKEISDLDVPLPDGTDDTAYLRRLQSLLPDLITQHQPDFCFYLAGVDVLATDKLGRLALTPAGCAARDRFVLETVCRKGIPVAISMGGGYSPRIRDIVNAHCETFRLAQRLYG